MIFEYNSNVAFGAAETDLRGHAEALLDSVHQARKETVSFAAAKYAQVEANLKLNTISRPIIFVGHSLGGLVIKQVIIPLFSLAVSTKFLS
jgi:alpha-beta hydrolase superfamily lysophospholipase